MRGDVETETMGLSDDLRVEEPAVDADALSVAAAALADAQQPVGAFVSSFEMAPRDLALALALTQPQLAQLQAECDPSDDVVHGWRRVRGKKGSRVRLWERGAASALTRTGVDGKLARALRRKSAAPTHDHGVARPRRQTSSPPSPGMATTTPTRETYAVRSSITVHAPLASVMKTLDCATATSYRSFTKIMYENLVADTSVLSHARVPSASTTDPTTPTHLAETLAVRWVVCKCSSPLVSDVDLSLVEYSKVHSIDERIAAGDAPHNHTNQDSDGGHDHDQGGANPAHHNDCDGLRVRERLPAAYKVLRSMETRHCPVLSEAPHHLERVHVPLGGFLLYTTDNEDITDVVFFLSATYERKRPPASGMAASFPTSDDRQFRAVQQVLHRLALGIGRIENAVDAYTMSLQLETLRLTRWIENSDRSECVVCYHRFHPLTRRRHHCRLCGDVICRDCSVHKDADLPTIGPTTLRICKLCDVQHFGRSSVLATIATDVKRTTTGLSAFQQRELALETTTFESPTVLRQRLRHRRQTDLSIEASKSSSKGGSSTLDSPTGKTIAMQRGRRHSLENVQPLSCPKPTLAPPRGLVERWASRNDPSHPMAATPSPLPPHQPQQASPGSGKWSKAFFASRTATMSPSSPLPHTVARTPTARATPLPSPPARLARTMPLPRSATKDVQSTTPSGSQRFNFGLMKGAAASSSHPQQSRSRQLSTGDRSPDSPVSQYNTTHGAADGVKNRHSSLSPRKYELRKTSRTESDNQSLESEPPRPSSLRDSSSALGRRARLDPIDQFEDLLRELCERASDAADARYAAISIFTSQNPAKSTSDGSALTMAHYLKVREAPKLMKIAPNLRCCEPILRVVRPVVTRNALTFRLDGYEFAHLPFVKGPQQARFYAGVPLVDSQQRLMGALAVFDAQLVDEEDEILDCPELLDSIARATMARIESRRADKALETFMNAPLLRSSEPLVVSRWGDDALDIDGGDDDDDDDVDEERVRSLHIPRRHASGLSSPVAAASSSFPSPSTNRLHHSQGPPSGSSTSKTNSLNYYKQQMHRLVQQANQTQDQVMQQTTTHLHGVSY